jgi:TonB-linked SusC/RagA family outer membrane protein
MDRYNAHLNLNISLSRKIELFASVGFSYINKTLQEQGLLDATNPILTAIYKAPILSPYKKDEYNHQLPTYDVVRQFGVTNPLAAVNTIDMNADLYNLFFDAGANYKLTKDIKLTGLLGLFYNYNRETGFIPGKSSGAIAPLEEGIALNTERAGTGQALNLHFNLNSQYSKKIGIHSINGSLGYQVLITQNEFDAGKGRNSSSDFYKTLSYVSTEGRQFWGYINMWNWMSTYAHADYTFNNILTAAFNVSLDGSSSSGKDAPRFGIFPSASLTWKVKNMIWLKNLDAINMLNLRAEYSVTGNSRFSSNISKYYYTGQIFRQLSGIVRGNIPNTNLKWESSNSLNFGMEASFLRNRIQASIDYYETLTGNVIIPKTISSVYGIDYIYDNAGKISNNGIELWIQAGAIESKDFGLVIGGTATMNKSILKSLGGEAERITEFEDGSAIISRVGESPFNFYGYKSIGVFSSQTEATAAALSDYKGDSFNAGDIHFTDIIADNVIDNRDRDLIGNADADLYGSVYTNIRFKSFSLTADFGYSLGNEAYNATRRKSESMSNFYNQSSAVNYRWQTDGQITEIPKAVYGDPMQNSRFSDRWIEDASYIRLNNLTLSYQLNKGLLRYIQSGTVFIAGENLFTITNYLGYDPETAYSYNPLMLGFDYAKLAIPRTVKCGVKLQF